MYINVAVICLNTLFYFIDMCLKNPQVISLLEPDDPLCVCGPNKCKMGKCWGFNMNLTTKRARPKQPHAASEAQQPQQAASVSPTKPTSPTKFTVTATLRSVVGRVAKQTFDAAASKINLARRIPEKHVCNHCTKCTVGSCQTCKCDKCKACQPSGKRVSALRPV